MIENRELTMDDYLAMLRRRMKVILIPALLAPLAGFLISYAFPAKYTSKSEVLVTPPKIPDMVVQQVFTEDLTQHITTIAAACLESRAVCGLWWSRSGWPRAARASTTWSLTSSST